MQSVANPPPQKTSDDHRDLRLTSVSGYIINLTLLGLPLYTIQSFPFYLHPFHSLSLQSPTSLRVLPVSPSFFVSVSICFSPCLSLSLSHSSIKFHSISHVLLPTCTLFTRPHQRLSRSLLGLDF